MNRFSVCTFLPRRISMTSSVGTITSAISSARPCCAAASLIASATFFSKFESTLTEYQRIAMSVRYLNSGSGALRSPCRLPRSNAPTKQNGAQPNRSAPASPSGSAP